MRRLCLGARSLGRACRALGQFLSVLIGETDGNREGVRGLSQTLCGRPALTLSRKGTRAQRQICRVAVSSSGEWEVMLKAVVVFHGNEIRHLKWCVQDGTYCH